MPKMAGGTPTQGTTLRLTKSGTIIISNLYIKDNECKVALNNGVCTDDNYYTGAINFDKTPYWITDTGLSSTFKFSKNTGATSVTSLI